MTIQELIDSLQRMIDEKWVTGDDQVFYDMWTYDDVAVQFEDDHDSVRARRVWKQVMRELSRFDEYPHHETIRDLIDEHIAKDLEANK